MSFYSRCTLSSSSSLQTIVYTGTLPLCLNFGPMMMNQTYNFVKIILNPLLFQCNKMFCILLFTDWFSAHLYARRVGSVPVPLPHNIPHTQGGVERNRKQRRTQRTHDARGTTQLSHFRTGFLFDLTVIIGFAS